MATTEDREALRVRLLAELRSEREHLAARAEAHLTAAEANLPLLRVPGAKPVRAELPVD